MIIASLKGLNNYVISVVIPIYNASSYLKNTITSLLEQTISDQLEIILVNDGSTDDSLNICTKFSNKYNRVRVFNQLNSGVSDARNSGIELATGYYIAFMDADDEVEDDYFEKLVNLIEEKHADVAIGDFKIVHPDGVIKKHRENYCKEWSSTDDALKGFFSGYIGNNVCDKIFKTDIAKGIRFPSGYRIGEDMYFVYKYICLASIVAIDTRICGYKYHIRSNSAMTGKFSEKYFDTLKLSNIMCEECEDNKIISAYAKAHLIHETCKVIEYTYKHNVEAQYKDYISIMRKDLYRYKIGDANRYLVKKQFWGFILMLISPNIYMFVHRIMRIG